MTPEELLAAIDEDVMGSKGPSSRYDVSPPPGEVFQVPILDNLPEVDWNGLSPAELADPDHSHFKHRSIEGLAGGWECSCLAISTDDGRNWRRDVDVNGADNPELKKQLDEVFGE